MPILLHNIGIQPIPTGDVSLLAGETDGLAIDFTSSTYFDSSTWAQLWNQKRVSSVDTYSSPHVFYTNAGTSPKVVKTSSTGLGWSPHNLVLRSQQFDNAAWAPFHVTIAADQIAAPDGTVTADKATIDSATNEHDAAFPATFVTVVDSAIHTASAYIKAGSGARYIGLAITAWNTGTKWAIATFDLNTGTVTDHQVGATGTYISSSITDVGSGWYRIALTASGITDTQIATNVVFSNSATPTVGNFGVISFAGNGSDNFYLWGCQLNRGIVPTAYVATTAAAVIGLPISYGEGLWVEPAATNLQIRSQEFDNAAWTKTHITLTADDTTAPDGSTTADKIVETNTSDSAVFTASNITISAGSTYTASIYVKSSNIQWFELFVPEDIGFARFAGAYFDLTNVVTGSTPVSGDTFVSSRIKAIGNGWFKCSLTATRSTTSTAILYVSSVTADAGSTRVTSGTYWLWGAQYELGTIATSYTPTVAASVTRAADSIASLASSFPIGGSAMSMLLVTVPLQVTTNWNYLNLSNGTTDNALFYTSGAGVHVFAEDNGATQADVILANLSVGVRAKIAARFTANDFHSAMNGTLAGSPDTSGTYPTVDRLQFFYPSSAASQSYIEKIIVLPRAYSNGELQSTTT